MVESSYSTLADWLRHKMEERGLTSARQLAQYTRIAHSAVAGYLRGEMRPSLESIRKLADYFKVDEDVILEIVRHEHGPKPPDMSDPHLNVMFYQLRDLTPEERRSVEDYIAFVRARRREREGRGER